MVHHSGKFSFRTSAISIFFLAFTGGFAQASTLSVCQSGCPYSSPSQALNAASDGDTIQVSGGTYNDCLYITKNDITVQGVNGMPAMTGAVCGQKGIIVTAGRNAVIRNIELYGATDSENYAGVRHDAAGFNLTLDTVYIHDNDDGILASSSGDSIVITNSKFVNNGMNASTGYGHNLYINHSASFVFRNSQSLQAKLGGHDLKSRAASTLVDSSVLASLGGEDSRCLDASEGGDVVIQNSVLEKGPSSQNNELIAFAPEAFNTGITQSFTMTGTKIIEDRGNGPVVYFFNLPSSITISGNTLVGPDPISNAGNPSGNTQFPDRGSSGYQAFPWLPAPGASALPPPAPASGWSHCADENGFCGFSGTQTVRYGANGTYVTGTFTGGVNCYNGTFGDPLPGVYKSCDVGGAASVPAPVLSWSHCADENGVCVFSGTQTVRYGANGVYFTGTFTGSVNCSNGTFGDPLSGVYKSCDVGGGGAVSSPSPSSWIDCAGENQTCGFSGTHTVRYGAGSAFNTGTFTNGVFCSNAVFGDPVVGTVKSCQYQ